MEPEYQALPSSLANGRLSASYTTTLGAAFSYFFKIIIIKIGIL